jgi:hypothetical protein
MASYSVAFNPRNILSALPTAVLSARDRDVEIFRLGRAIQAPKQRDRLTAYHALSKFQPEFQEAQIEKLADNMPQRELQELQKKYYQDRTRRLEQQVTQETQTGEIDVGEGFFGLGESFFGGGGDESPRGSQASSEQMEFNLEQAASQTASENPFGAGTLGRAALRQLRRAGGGDIPFISEMTAQEAAEQVIARTEQASGQSTPSRLLTKGKIPSSRNVLFGVRLAEREIKELPESFRQEALMQRGALAQGTDIIEEYSQRPAQSRLLSKGKIQSRAVRVSEIASDVAGQFGGQYAGESMFGGGQAAGLIGYGGYGEPPQQLLLERGLEKAIKKYGNQLQDATAAFTEYIKMNPISGDYKGFKRYIQQMLNPSRSVSATTVQGSRGFEGGAVKRYEPQGGGAESFSLYD